MILIRRVSLVVIAGSLVFARVSNAQTAQNRYINPPGLVAPAGYTHVIVAADGRTVYIAGQIAVDSTGRVVGTDLREQTEQVFANLRRALASVGASFSDLVKTTTYIKDASQSTIVREVRARYFDPARAPTNTLVPVPMLARPELLIEIEAIAVLSTPRSP